MNAYLQRKDLIVYKNMYDDPIHHYKDALSTAKTESGIFKPGPYFSIFWYLNR